MSRKQQTVGSLALAGYEDIFNIGKINSDGEYIVEMPLEEMFSPEFHPFQVNDDESI